MRLLVQLLLAVVGLIAGLSLLLFFAQRRLLYFPSHQDREAATREAEGRELQPWLGSDGSFLGWRAPHPSGQPTGKLLVLHGNAGSALERGYLRDAFQAPGLPLALDIYLLEYPGYGPRSGTLSEDDLVSAGTEAIDLLSAASPGPLFLAGESLGSAVGVLAAARRPRAVAGLILITPLTSVPAVARRHFPMVPAFLIRDTLRTDRALPRYSGPVAFLIAGRDSVVFPDLGEALFAAYRGPKQKWVEARADHNTLDYDPRRRIWGELLAFLAAAH